MSCSAQIVRDTLPSDASACTHPRASHVAAALTGELMNRIGMAAFLSLVGVLTSSVGSAQAGRPMKEEKAGLLVRATVAPDSARRLALAQVPNGRIMEEEIEEENGKLVFSFDIKVPGKSGVDEVQIDARSGALVSKEHETPRQSARERAPDARAPRNPARP